MVSGRWNENETKMYPMSSRIWSQVTPVTSTHCCFPYPLWAEECQWVWGGGGLVPNLHRSISVLQEVVAKWQGTWWEYFLERIYTFYAKLHTCMTWAHILPNIWQTYGAYSSLTIILYHNPLHIMYRFCLWLAIIILAPCGCQKRYC